MSTFLKEGKKHTILVTASSANIQVYVDGILIGTRRGRGFYDANIIKFIRSFADVTDIYIWNRRLPQKEISYFFSLMKNMSKQRKKLAVSVKDEKDYRIYGNHIITNQSQDLLLPGRHTPPYTIRAKCKTSHENIRFLLLGGIIIFNWECDRNCLRADVPNLMLPHGFSGKGYIEPDKWANIKIKVTEEKLSIYVNGKLRVTQKGSFKNFRSFIGMRTYQNNIITVRSFSVEHD